MELSDGVKRPIPSIEVEIDLPRNTLTPQLHRSPLPIREQKKARPFGAGFLP